MWKATFTLVYTPEMIQHLPAPDGIANAKEETFLYFPILSQLAFTANNTIFIWDAQNSRFLLKYDSLPWSREQSLSFSAGGCFFLHPTDSKDIYIWKRFHTSYILHQKVVLHVPVDSLLSPDGKSIIAASYQTIHLVHTKDQILSFPSDPVSSNGSRFILKFFLNEGVAAFAPDNGNTVTILDLQSGNLQLVIDAGADMNIRCLGVTGSTVAVSDGKKIITWNLPAQNCINVTAGINDSVHATTLDHPDEYTDSQSISPDLSQITIVDRCQGHSSLDAPSELNPLQRIPSLLDALLVPQAEG